MKNLFALIMVLSAFSQSGIAQHTKKSTPAFGHFWEYLPPGYNDPANASRQYPVIIFMHGAGEKGCSGCNTPAELDKVLVFGPPEEINTGHNMCFTINGVEQCFIVISPQLGNGNGQTSWTSAHVEKIVNYVLNPVNYRIDLSRVYITGLSLGGIGTYDYAKSTRYFAESVAAIAPVAGRASSLTNICNIATNDTPVWAFHGDADNTVPFSSDQNLINSLINCVPAPDPMPIFTVFPGVGHDNIVWNTAYKTDHSSHNPNLYEWFLLNPKGTAANIPPSVSAGIDLQVQLPASSAQLSGTASDTDGTISTYQWTQQSGPSTATLTGTTQAQLTASNLVAGNYIFRLTATDNQGATSFDEATVAVLPAQSNGNWLEIGAISPAGKSIAMYYNAQKSNAVQLAVRNSGNDYLHFYLKTISGSVNWTSLRVELTVSHQTKSVLVSDYITSVSGNWTAVQIPLNDFQHDPARWQGTGGVSLVALKSTSGFGTGNFGLDEIQFTGGTQPFTWYGDSYDVSGSTAAVNENSTIFNIVNRHAAGGFAGQSLARARQSADIPTVQAQTSGGDVIYIFNHLGQLIKKVTLDKPADSEKVADYVDQPGLTIFNIVAPSGRTKSGKIYIRP